MKGIIIDWLGTLATIPADWLLCDGNNSTPNLLGKYLLSVGAGENSGAIGGSTTHVHPSPAHTHTQDSHNHTGTTGDFSGEVHQTASMTSSLSYPTHTHTYTTDGTIAVNQNSTDAVDGSSNDPVYYKVAPIIDSTSYGVKYPINSIVFWAQTTLPAGWYACDGNNDTPDLRNKFLKCVNVSENPGATGGSATHNHTTTHTHIQDGHTHTGTTGYSNSCVTNSGNRSGGVRCNHSHSITTSNVSAVNQDNADTTGTENGEPTFKKLLIIKNTLVGNRPRYSIVKWAGTIANIPLGYVLCDGNTGTPNLLDCFIKGALDYTEINNAGGSSTHLHTTTSHNHTQNSHTHSVTADSYGDNNGYYVYDPWIAGTHTHQAANSDSTTATNQVSTMTISNCSSQANYPPYYKVAYIMQYLDLDAGAYAFLV